MFDINELPLRSEKYDDYGTITKNTISSYKISKGSKYYCSCRTYEQAYYVKSELNKNGWDKQKIPKILDEYPIFYTKLLELYRYITTRKNNKRVWWVLSIPSTKSKSGLLEHITSLNLEPLLYERDFLIEHDWDYELLVEQIDDSKNPYYERVLPPYPERKIKNNRFRNPHTKELQLFQKLLIENPYRSQSEISKLTGINDMNIRNWLHNYGLDWYSFRSLALSCDGDISKHIKLKPLIFQPDLSPHKPQFKGYIHKNNSNRNPFAIKYKTKQYGTYPNLKLAKKVRDELIKCDWDKSKLKSIRQKYGLETVIRDYIYQSSSGKFVIYKKINGTQYYYGTYDAFEIAEKVRDELIKCDWDKSELDNIVERVT